MDSAASPYDRDALAFARQVVEEAKSSPERGLASASTLAVSADPLERVAGLWARGTAYYEQGLNLEAIEAFRAALAIDHVGLGQWIAVSLAAAEVAAGDRDDARRRLEPIAASAEDHELQASASAQLGFLSIHDGEPRRALHYLEEAVALLDRRQADHPLLARAWGNVGVCHMLLGRLREAEDAWLTAHRHASLADQDLVIAGLQQNLAYTRMCLGDLPGAIDCGRKALALYRQLGEAGRNLSTLYDDLAEIHRFAGLSKDAVRFARLSLWVARQGTNLEKQSDAEFRRARCLLDTGNYRAAAASAQAAAEMFAVADRTVWVRRAQLLALEAASNRVGDDQAVVDATTLGDTAAEISAELVGAGWIGESMAARNMAAQLIAERGDIELARRVLSDNPSPAVIASENMSDRLEAIYSAALSSRLSGQDCAPMLVEARRLVEESRSGLVDPELRAGVARQLARFRDLDVDQVVDGLADSWALVEADERWRGMSDNSGLSPSSQPDDGDLLSELRLLHQKRTLATERDADVDDRILEVEREIRERSMARTAHHPETHQESALKYDRHLLQERLDAAAESTSGTSVVVSFVVHRGTLYGAGFNVEGEERTEGVWTVGPVDDVKSVVDRASGDFARLPSSPSHSRTAKATWQALKADYRQLAKRMFGHRVGHGRALVVAPPFELGAVPWSLIADQASTVSVVGSVAQWCRELVPQPPASVTLVSGPDLPQASVEVDAVNACFKGADVSVIEGDGARSGDLLSALGSRDLVHVSAHCSFRDDSVMFSSIEMVDGPVPIYELGRLRDTPSLVVLAACGAGRWQGVGSAQWLGIVPELLRSGTDCLVAPIQAVADSDAGTVMAEFYRHLRQLGAAGALAATQTALADASPRVQAAAHSFVVFGTASAGCGSAST